MPAWTKKNNILDPPVIFNYYPASCHPSSLSLSADQWNIYPSFKRRNTTIWRSGMMERAGYIQRNGCRAYDSDGILHEVIDVHIQGSRYAIRTAGLAVAITGRVFVQVEELTHNWNYYLGLTCGLAQVSVSGKALNLNLFNDGCFTVSLGALRSIMYGKDKYAFIMKIPDKSVQLSKMKRLSQDQKQISAIV